MQIDHYGFIFTILVSISIVLIIITLFWHINYSKIAKKTRCYVPNSRNKKIKIVAKDFNDQPMYNIKYDLKRKSSSVNCACDPGNVMNVFKDIKVRRLDTFEDTTVEKTCACNEKFDMLNQLSTYYYGTPGLVRYMKTNDDSVFDVAYIDQSVS